MTETKIKTALFLGCHVTPDLRISLNQSIAWKNAKIAIEGELKEQRHQGKDYLGIFLSPEQNTLPAIREVEKHIRSRLHNYCPNHNTDSLPIYLLSIVLVA
jgi:hypothetical protein